MPVATAHNIPTRSVHTETTSGQEHTGTAVLFTFLQCVANYEHPDNHVLQVVLNSLSCLQYENIFLLLFWLSHTNNQKTNHLRQIFKGIIKVITILT